MLPQVALANLVLNAKSRSMPLFRWVSPTCLLRLQLERLETAEKDLAALEHNIQSKLEPYAAQMALL